MDEAAFLKDQDYDILNALNAKGEHVLKLAISLYPDSHIEMVRKLLRHGASVDAAHPRGVHAFVTYIRHLESEINAKRDTESQKRGRLTELGKHDAIVGGVQRVNFTEVIQEIMKYNSERGTSIET